MDHNTFSVTSIPVSLLFHKVGVSEDHVVWGSDVKCAIHGTEVGVVLSHLPRLAQIKILYSAILQFIWRNHGCQMLYFDKRELGGKMQQIVKPPTILGDGRNLTTGTRTSFETRQVGRSLDICGCGERAKKKKSKSISIPSSAHQVALERKFVNKNF